MPDIPITTWAELKTALEGSPSAGDRYICSTPLTVTSTITIAADGAVGDPIIVQGAGWDAQTFITGLDDTTSFEIIGRQNIVIQYFEQVGGSHFVEFSGTCVNVEILRCKGSQWTHSVSADTQFIGAGGGSRTGCRVAWCEGFDANHDFFSTAGSYGWICEYNWVHDLGVPYSLSNVDAFAFHQSDAALSIVRYNRIERCYGKSAISVGNVGGSWVDVYGNYVYECHRGVLYQGTDVLGYCYNNVVIMTDRIPQGSLSVFGIGALTGDSPNGDVKFYNNYVYNGSKASYVFAYVFDTLFEFVNNVAVVGNDTAKFYYISAGSVGFGSTLADNHFWSTDGVEGARIEIASVNYTLAQVQGLLPGAEAGTLFSDPEIFGFAPTDAIGAAPKPGSPLIGTGTDLSGTFTEDIHQRTRSVWTKGPWDAVALPTRVAADRLKILNLDEQRDASWGPRLTAAQHDAIAQGGNGVTDGALVSLMTSLMVGAGHDDGTYLLDFSDPNNSMYEGV